MNAVWLTMAMSVVMILAAFLPPIVHALFASSGLEVIRVRCNNTGVEARRNDRARGGGPPRVFFE
jgi:hypothetical protein